MYFTISYLNISLNIQIAYLYFIMLSRWYLKWISQGFYETGGGGGWSKGEEGDKGVLYEKRNKGGSESGKKGGWMSGTIQAETDCFLSSVIN